jgi:myo-inositol 2-dehydrogenase/D-chiro-inositol 1-dehydrogenase
MRKVPGVEVVAIADVDPARAAMVAAEDAPGARVVAEGATLIAANDVGAVLIASPGFAHEPSVLAAIAHGKPVFCEKPLAPTADGCLRILDAEVAYGRRLVQVGFMRRYDASYRAMKDVLGRGGVGTSLMVHCAHRNATPPPHFTSEMLINDAAIHEIDVVRWLLDQELATASVWAPRRTSKAPAALQDPLIVLLETEQGVTIDDEVFVSAGYGYDIRCEVVGETGAVALDDGGGARLRSAGRSAVAVPSTFLDRFEDAYDAELRAWAASVAAGTATGPGSWDGYAATLVADACLAALRSGQRTPIALRPRPALYA